MDIESKKLIFLTMQINCTNIMKFNVTPLIFIGLSLFATVCLHSCGDHNNFVLNIEMIDMV